MDDFTRYAWVYFSYLKDAATVTPLIQAFIALILTQFGVVIQRWRTDGGTGISNHLSLSDIRHDSPALDSPYQTAERRYRASYPNDKEYGAYVNLRKEQCSGADQPAMLLGYVTALHICLSCLEKVVEKVVAEAISR